MEKETGRWEGTGTGTGRANGGDIFCLLVILYSTVFLFFSFSFVGMGHMR